MTESGCMHVSALGVHSECLVKARNSPSDAKTQMRSMKLKQRSSRVLIKIKLGTSKQISRCREFQPAG